MIDLFEEGERLAIPKSTRLVHGPPEKILLTEHCYCPNGHDLINRRYKLNGNAGIYIEVTRGADQKGEVVLSPIYGDRTRCEIGLDLVPGEVFTFMCPICKAELPTLDRCVCHRGDLHMLYLDKNLSKDDAIIICDVVDCFNSYIITDGTILNHFSLGGY